MASETRENNYSIQFLRFIFAIVMCFGHALAVTMLAAYSQYDVLKYSIKGCFRKNGVKLRKRRRARCQKRPRVRCFARFH